MSHGGGTNIGGRILVVGVYLPAAPNDVRGIVRELASTTGFDVVQRWYACGGDALPEVAEVTVGGTPCRTPQYVLRNRILRAEDLTRYEYVLHMEDDVVLPPQFVHRLVSYQRRHDFAIAQPARTRDSFTDMEFILQIPEIEARQTLWIDCGPVVSYHRSVYDLVFPYDDGNGMGWGFGQVWGYHSRERGFRMGIIDAVPVRHALRPQASTYDTREASAMRAAYLSARPHLRPGEAVRNLVVHRAGPWRGPDH
jgi:hypothetical protein